MGSNISSAASNQVKRLRGSSVLVTGSGGVLGAALVPLLHNSEAKTVLTPSRNDLDLRDEEQVRSYLAKHCPDYIFHLASLVYGLGGNLQHRFQALSVNTAINNSFFSAISRQDHLPKKIFFAGTVASYPYPYPELPLREETFFDGQPHAGEFGYGLAKRHAYGYLKLLKEVQNVEFCYGIFTNIFGPYDRFDEVKGHVVPSLVAKLYQAKTLDQPLRVWGDGSATRDFISSSFAASAALNLMESEAGIYNVSTGVEVSIRKIVETLVEIACYSGPVIWEADRPVGIERRVVSPAKMISAGVLPNQDLRRELEATWSWYCANRADVRT
jgi:GDP-L-fucose synthase